MSASNWKPVYQPWYESDFFGSLAVRRMIPIERLMYRALLQAAWNTDNPPYLPNVDAELMALADAPSSEEWEKHKAVILERFQRTEDGRLYHRKTLAQFEDARWMHERQSDAGKRRWQTHTKPETRKGKAKKTALSASEIAQRQQAGEEWRG